MSERRRYIRGDFPPSFLVYQSEMEIIVSILLFLATGALVGAAISSARATNRMVEISREQTKISRTQTEIMEGQRKISELVLFLIQITQSFDRFRLYLTVPMDIGKGFQDREDRFRNQHKEIMRRTHEYLREGDYDGAKEYLADAGDLLENFREYLGGFDTEAKRADKFMRYAVDEWVKSQMLIKAFEKRLKDGFGTMETEFFDKKWAEQLLKDVSDIFGMHFDTSEDAELGGDEGGGAGPSLDDVG